jgi:hypothetical protein
MVGTPQETPTKNLSPALPSSPLIRSPRPSISQNPPITPSRPTTTASETPGTATTIATLTPITPAQRKNEIEIYYDNSGPLVSMGLRPRKELKSPLTGSESPLSRKRRRARSFAEQRKRNRTSSSSPTPADVQMEETQALSVGYSGAQQSEALNDCWSPVHNMALNVEDV